MAVERTTRWDARRPSDGRHARWLWWRVSSGEWSTHPGSGRVSSVVSSTRPGRVACRPLVGRIVARWWLAGGRPELSVGWSTCRRSSRVSSGGWSTPAGSGSGLVRGAEQVTFGWRRVLSIGWSARGCAGGLRGWVACVVPLVVDMPGSVRVSTPWAAELAACRWVARVVRWMDDTWSCRLAARWVSGVSSGERSIRFVGGWCVLFGGWSARGRVSG